MSKSFNTPHKNLIRTAWAKPILQFLNRRLGYRLVYLGLPGAEAEDIDEWLEYLRHVIAFQCEDPRYPNAFEQLRTKLQSLEREKKLDNFQVYKGYMEKVLLQGYDDAEERQDFYQSEVVTVYNLDFCDKISSPIKFKDINGSLQKAYKFEAINRLLEIQRRLEGVSKKFILFLTVHCSYDGEELQLFVANPSSPEIKTHLAKSFQLKGNEKNARIVRLFVLETLQVYIRSLGFTPKFLPTIFYQGLRDTFLLHFTILATSNPATPGAAPWLQNIPSLVNEAFITVETGTFTNLVIKELAEALHPNLDPVAIFSNSDTYRKFWATK